MWPPQVLLTLPENSRQDYFQLLAEPLLMLEQLLMNLKVDWATAAVSTLRNLLPAQEAGITNQHIDTLLAEYSRKALDFPYAPRERTRSGEQNISLLLALNRHNKWGKNVHMQHNVFLDISKAQEVFKLFIYCNYLHF